MKEANIGDMELGNLMFGNSRGKYLVEPRNDYQEIFIEFLCNNGFDGYGHRVKDYTGVFETDKFIIRPYYWGENEEIAKLPNFVYKPTWLEVKWYKYPMRDAYSNQDIDIKTFAEIIRDCEMSLREQVQE